VLHVHSVDAIAWAVRRDALVHLEQRLEGLRWQWIPYIGSGLPLAREIQRCLTTHPDTDLFVLGNHGLVLGAHDVDKLDDLLIEVRRRIEIVPRRTHPADYSVMANICACSHWDIPDDDDVHALATDAVARSILAGGLLYPCQAIFSGVGTHELFRPVPCNPGEREIRYSNRPFLLIEKCGVILNKSARPAERAMISGLAQVVRRLHTSAPIRYLTEAEVAGLSCEVAYRYRDLANAGQSYGGGSSRLGY